MKYADSVLARRAARLVVAELAEVKEELGAEMVEVFTPFFARFYGWRLARNRAKEAIEAIKQ